MSTTEPAAVTDTTFHHVDDIAWTPVQQQRNADGTVSVVRERWPIIRPGFLSAYVHYEPNMVVRRHGHRSNPVVVVLDGGAWIGDEWSTADTHIHVPLGATFGPIVAGPDGVTCWELSFGEFGGWGDDPASYDHAIARRGIVPLPDPPLHIGDWFVDPRGDTGAVRSTPRVPGLAERTTRFADLPTHVLRRQRNADGTTAALRTTWAVATPAFASALVEYDAGMIVRRERHEGRHLVLVIEGGAWIGDRWCSTGTHVEVPPGASIGPIVAGDRGMRTLELTDADLRTVGVDRADHEALLAEHGTTALADPVLDPGGWFTDTRGVWLEG